jgi:hypothetical protein
MNPKTTHIKALSGTGLIVLSTALACALPAVSESPPGGDANIAVINSQSYPTGAADLRITAVAGTEFNKDLDFPEVRCGDETLNYKCSETGTETSKVIASGKPHNPNIYYTVKKND